MKHIISFSDKFPDLREDISDIFLEFKEDHGFNVYIIPDVKIIPAISTSSLFVGHNFTYPSSYERNVGYTPVGDWMWGYVVLLSKTVGLSKNTRYYKKRGKHKEVILNNVDKTPIEKVDEFIIRKSKLIKDRTPQKIELYGVKSTTSPTVFTRVDDIYHECRYEFAFI